MTTGLVTPTEASVLAVLYTLFLGVIHREITRERCSAGLRGVHARDRADHVPHRARHVMGFVMTSERAARSMAQWMVSFTDTDMWCSAGGTGAAGHGHLPGGDSGDADRGSAVRAAGGQLRRRPDPLRRRAHLRDPALGIVHPPIGLGIFAVCAIRGCAWKPVVRATLLFYPVFICACSADVHPGALDVATERAMSIRGELLLSSDTLTPMKFLVFSIFCAKPLRATSAGRSNGARPSRSPQYDVVIVGAGGHGLATAYYLAKEHGITNVAVLEKGWLGGGNTGRNTTIIRSNYLWDESAALYEHALKLWEGLSQELNYNVMYSPRGVMMLAHTVHDVQVFKRHVHANRLNGIDNEWLTPAEARRSARRSTSRPTSAIRCSAPRCSGAAARRATMRSPGAMRAAPTRCGVDIIQNCEVTASAAMRTARSSGVETTRGTIRRQESASSRPAIPAWSWRWPACACRSRAIRCRRWCRSR